MFHCGIKMLFLLIIQNRIGSIQCQNSTIDILALIQNDQTEVRNWIQNLFDHQSTTTTINTQLTMIAVAHEDIDRQQICQNIKNRATIILDLTWPGTEAAKSIVNDLNMPYIHLDLSISPHLRLLDQYMRLRNSSDVVIVFDQEKYIDEAIYYWLDTTILRLITAETIDDQSARKLRKIRPIPTNYAIIGDTNNVTRLFRRAMHQNLTNLHDRWILVFLDFKFENFPKNLIHNQTTLITLDYKHCCTLQGQPSCTCPKEFNMQKTFLQHFFENLLPILSEMSPELDSSSARASCPSTTFDAEVKLLFDTQVMKMIDQSDLMWFDAGVIRLRTAGIVEVGTGGGNKKLIAQNNIEQMLIAENPSEIRSVKPFYRIGTTYAMPWAYKYKDPETGEMKWTGYCIDFAEKIAESLGFDYELVEPESGTFGSKDENGTWDGIVGDLDRGDTDIAVAALVMTADREEVIDFIAPYFEESGISIVMRKPVRKTSLFKFMTVLKLEVWLSIIAALVVTAIMLWFLDKYSPYSARNNKKAFPYPTREFTIKESFWFALTSFTPQGGGEAPKALSARTLVAAYWLFVVLMLATFTANLAAFLTVERMQTPVQSLEQLGRQSRMNYTVVEASLTHEYFINMKFAEDTLYRLWKELTLNASSDDKRYRVWDYPIREQYGTILIAINDSIPVRNAYEGFLRVNERTEADFAFIHDSAEIKYEITRNCNLTEVGEVFAEKPYAVAVQQGSHLQDPLSLTIIDLQESRFLENLKSKYWNKSLNQECASADDSEGINLESLGGVFIATLFGLVLSMVTLGIEVIYYKRKFRNRSAIEPIKKPGDTLKENMLLKTTGAVTITKSFQPIKFPDASKKISYISVYPRNRYPNITYLN